MNDITLLKKWVDQAESASYEARQLSERDRDYYDGNQLTQSEINTLRKRKQPIVVDNRIQPMVNHLLGLEVQRRTDPRALPRTPQHEKDAEAVTDALRFVEERTEFDRTASRAFEDKMVEGACGAEVGVEVVNGKYEITIRRYAWDRMGWDPASTESDFSDARYLYVLTWMDYDEAVATWPQAAEVLEETIASGDNETSDDKPKHQAWRDSTRKRVKIALMYYRDPQGTWNYSLFSGGGEIQGGPSPYLDENGEPECPLIFDSAYVDRDNNRYGVVRSMITLQDEVNKRRSKLLHIINSRQFMYESGAVQDIRRAKQEMAAPDGAIEVAPGKTLQLLDQGSQVAGQFALHAESMQALDRLGPSAMGAGKTTDASGRAILAAQQGGLVELAKLFDGHSHWKRRVYRAVWNRIRQYWTEERWVRVTDDESNVRFVGLNRQTTMGEMFVSRLRDQNVPEDQAKMQLVQNLQQQGLPMEAMLMPMVDGQVSKIDVDIIIDEAPDTASLQYEQFEMLTGLAQAGVVFPPKVYIEAAPNLRNRQKLIEIIEGQENPEAAAQQAEMPQRAIALEFAQKAADVEKTKAEIVKLQSEAIENKADAINKTSQAAATRVQVMTPPQAV